MLKKMGYKIKKYHTLSSKSIFVKYYSKNTFYDWSTLDTWYHISQGNDGDLLIIIFKINSNRVFQN